MGSDIRFLQNTGAVLAVATLIAFAGCESGGGGASTGTGWLGKHAATVLAGTNDNAEVVRVIPGGRHALLLSSKARKLTLLDTTGGDLAVVRDRAIFPDDASESELTSLDVAADGTWAVATRTRIETGTDGQQTKCGGSAVFLDLADSDAFGTVLAEVEVGPMPDAIDISDDGHSVAVANERDGPDAWGKCLVATATPSISIVDVSEGPSKARELFRVEMKDATTGPREPEGIVFGKDSDLVVATLQDSHEVVLFRVSALVGKTAPTSEDTTIVHLPANGLGAYPWPDGVARFEDSKGVEHFVTAGEWNDTFTILDGTGAIVSTTEVSDRDIPSDLPRVVDAGSPLFSPDSVSTFRMKGRTYASFSLRHSGAVAVYDVSDAAAPAFVQAIAVGKDEQGKADPDGSTIRPEGVSAAADGSFLVVANEAESSASLILRIE